MRRVSSCRLSARSFCCLSGENSQRDVSCPRDQRSHELALRENPDERAARRRFRDEIAYEPIWGADLHVTSGLTRAVDEHCAYWRLVRVRYRELLEPIIVHQLLAGLLRQSCLWPRFHRARGNERFFHKMPALRKRVRVSAFLRDRRGAPQLWINPCVDLGKGLHDFLRIILVHYFDRLLFTGTIFVNKLRVRRRWWWWFPLRCCRKRKASEREQRERSVNNLRYSFQVFVFHLFLFWGKLFRLS